MEQIGVVVGVNDDDSANVLFKRHTMCESCGQCRGPKENVTRVNNSIGAQRGDWVMVTIAGGNIMQAALAVYLIPLLTLVAGYLLGFRIWHKELIGIITGIGFMGITFLGIKLWDKSLGGKGKFAPQINRLAYEDEIKDFS